MRTIVHLSDLHFGREKPEVLAPLREAIVAVGPDLIAVSGDLTQRARRGQFRRAARFLDSIPGPRIIVPGNHDVPLYDVFSRFFRPLANFRRFVTEDPEPFYEDSEIAVAGLNTTRSLTFKRGRINPEQLERLCARFARARPGTTRIVVTHHPFDVPPGRERMLVGRARMAIESLARSDVRILLAGHLHVPYTVRSAIRYRIPGHSALIVQAGTATSTRQRGKPNSFNVLRVQHPRVSVEIFIGADDGAFRPSALQSYRLEGADWVRTWPAPEPSFAQP